MLGLSGRVRHACMSLGRRSTIGRKAKILAITDTSRSGHCLSADVGVVIKATFCQEAYPQATECFLSTCD